MELNIRCCNITTIVITLCIVASTLVHSTHVTESSKPGKTYFLCGEAFLEVYDMVCKLKTERRYRGVKRRRRRALAGIEKDPTLQVMEAHKANNFLHPLRRLRRSTDTDDANEECCLEGCSIQEIAEYEC